MSSKVIHQTHFTRQVKSLLDRIFGRSIVKDSVLDRAVSYYHEFPTVDAERSRLKNSNDLEKELKLVKRQYS